MLVVISLYYFKKDTYYLNPVIYNQIIPVQNNLESKLVIPSKIIINSSAKKILDCTKDDLMKANGVGEKTASLIIENILSKKIKSVADIDDLKGIGPKTINEIKKYCY